MAQRPYFKGMTDEQLRDAYWAARNNAANWANLATPRGKSSTRSRAATGVLSNLRDLDLIIAIARKRGLDLLKESN